MIWVKSKKLYVPWEASTISLTPNRPLQILKFSTLLWPAKLALQKRRYQAYPTRKSSIKIQSMISSTYKHIKSQLNYIQKDKKVPNSWLFTLRDEILLFVYLFKYTTHSTTWQDIRRKLDSSYKQFLFSLQTKAWKKNTYL